MKILTTLILTGGFATPALACDLCAIYSANQARGEIGKGPFAGVAEQFTHFGSVEEDGDKAPNPSGQYLDSSISQLFAGYNFNERIGVQLNLPLIYRSFKRPEAAGIDRGTISGLGDISLIGHIQAYRQVRAHFGTQLVGPSERDLRSQINGLYTRVFGLLALKRVAALDFTRDNRLQTQRVFVAQQQQKSRPTRPGQIVRELIVEIPLGADRILRRGSEKGSLPAREKTRPDDAIKRSGA